ncbi:MAG: hypothetical protein A3B07_01415 [Candidatus Yonathbacteria bacterium RIFCSPLOWO2_01_FULL_43_27]|uniref:GIY-YIG domain-containing protein n=1 Tax=Candidatus Yonathbacteria bacterium RIFCSPLOWO2_01_FULL_43_27 TaxID=1802726 RepID=A0A1G2SC22_9BACT|nr:MAG: hypothetical protein A2658_01205 [Candidatus Yonathbacteria bacterium RIFCSPHIGHO2_01_FULL_44_19]OHA82576.1 MAG: hypothetical protein A3B07_01415 [Candidatus Yonathbacteria bacterium RIFCSPLOWO2_01_FULL_43_27]
MPYFVYILMSERDKRLYVGCTHNVEQRLKAHQSGKVIATKQRRPLLLIHSEKFLSKTEAFTRERFLKSLWGAREKRKIFQNYVSKIGHTL